MRIAVNARHLHAHLEGVGIVTDQVMRRISRSHPDDQFDYYFDQRHDRRFVHAPNVHAHTFLPPTRLPFLIRFWLNQPVRRHATRHQANVFFSPDGFIPLGMGIPKVSMVHDVAFLRYPDMLQPRIRQFYATWMPRYLAYTDHIITVSHFSKDELIAGYNLPPEKISVVYNGITEDFQPLEDPQKESVRQQYTGGRPYFLYLGAIHPRKNIPALLKAFELFKSSGSTSHQLVLGGRASWHTEDVFNAIERHPFKQDIHVQGYIPTEKATKLVGAAEAMIYPSWYEGFGLPLVEAMACAVPVISSQVTSLPEIAGDAALYFDPNSPEALATHMKEITADATLRQRLIDAGQQRKLDFSWDHASASIYQILTRFAR